MEYANDHKLWLFMISRAIIVQTTMICSLLFIRTPLANVHKLISVTQLLFVQLELFQCMKHSQQNFS